MEISGTPASMIERMTLWVSSLFVSMMTSPLEVSTTSVRVPRLPSSSIGTTPTDPAP